jgi:dihydroxy-acid dehydratase
VLELYLVRHGVAEDRGDDWPDDSKRPLTNAGLAKLRKEARGLVAMGVSIDQIITSPLVRTRQTADVLAEILKNKPPIVLSDALAPAGTPDWAKRGYAHLFNETILQADEGCDFDFMRGQQGKD